MYHIKVSIIASPKFLSACPRPMCKAWYLVLSYLDTSYQVYQTSGTRCPVPDVLYQTSWGLCCSGCSVPDLWQEVGCSLMLGPTSWSLWATSHFIAMAWCICHNRLNMATTQYDTNINNSDYNDKQQGIESLQWLLQECITSSEAEQWQHLHLSLQLKWHQP